MIAFVIIYYFILLLLLFLFSIFSFNMYLYKYKVRQGIIFLNILNIILSWDNTMCSTTYNNLKTRSKNENEEQNFTMVKMNLSKLPLFCLVNFGSAYPGHLFVSLLVKIMNASTHINEEWRTGDWQYDTDPQNGKSIRI